MIKLISPTGTVVTYSFAQYVIHGKDYVYLYDSDKQNTCYAVVSRESDWLVEINNNCSIKNPTTKSKRYD